MDKGILDTNGILKQEEFLPTSFYKRFKIGHTKDDTTLHPSELKFMGQLNKESEQFLFNAWKSFLRAKEEFLSSGKSIKEIYEESDDNKGLENYGYIDFARSIFSLVRLDEDHLDEINFQHLRSDVDYYKICRKIYSINLDNEKTKFIDFRNAIAHNRYFLFAKNGIPMIDIVLGINEKEKKVELSFKEFCDYVAFVEKHINEKVAKYFKDQDRRNSIQLYRKLFGVDNALELPEEKREIIDFIYNKPEKTMPEVKSNINTTLNDLMLEYPEKTRDEIFDLLFKHIRQNYTVFDDEDNVVNTKREKSTAMFFAESREMQKAEDVLEVAQYVFSTNRYKKVIKHEGLSQELVDFLESKFDTKKIILENQLNIKDNETYTHAFLENIRHSIFHDKAIIDQSGNIIFRMRNIEGKRAYRRYKDKVQKLNINHADYYPELYRLSKANAEKTNTVITICRLTPTEVMYICEQIMGGGSPVTSEQEVHVKEKSTSQVNKSQIAGERGEEVFDNENIKNPKPENIIKEKKLTKKQLRQQERKKKIAERNARGVAHQKHKTHEEDEEKENE